MITCIHCRQRHEDARHECLKDMSLEEVMELPEGVTIHLMMREYRARFLQAIFEGGDPQRIAESPLGFNRANLVDSIALARQKMVTDVTGRPIDQAYLDEFDKMAEGIVDRLFPEEGKG